MYLNKIGLLELFDIYMYIRVYVCTYTQNPEGRPHAIGFITKVENNGD